MLRLVIRHWGVGAHGEDRFSHGTAHMFLLLQRDLNKLDFLAEEEMAEAEILVILCSVRNFSCQMEGSIQTRMCVKWALCVHHLC